jgi:hypothetical protein
MLAEMAAALAKICGLQPNSPRCHRANSISQWKANIVALQ